jgi:hypothetical protein
MATTTKPEILSVDEAIARHPNEWIFMQVTREDDHHAPSHGVVLAHHPKRGIIQRSIMRIIAHRKGDEVYYLTFGERRFKSREERIAAINSMIRNGS